MPDRPGRGRVLATQNDMRELLRDENQNYADLAIFLLRTTARNNQHTKLRRKENRRTRRDLILKRVGRAQKFLGC